MRTTELPDDLRSATADWAAAYPRPNDAETRWAPALERELQPAVRSAVLAAVRGENRRSFALAAVTGLLVVAVAAILVLGAHALLRLDVVATSVVAAVAALVATLVVARLMRRVRTGDRYTARVLELHGAFVAAATETARPLLAGRAAGDPASPVPTDGDDHDAVR